MPPHLPKSSLKASVTHACTSSFHFPQVPPSLDVGKRLVTWTLIILYFPDHKSILRKHFSKETCIHWIENRQPIHLNLTAKDFLKWQSKEDSLCFVINLFHTITVYESFQDSMIHSVIHKQKSHLMRTNGLLFLTFNKKKIYFICSTKWKYSLISSSW